MSDKTLNLFDFGNNSNGEYVNLVEEEERLKDISKEELNAWVRNHNDPLIRIAFDSFVGYYELEKSTNNKIKEKLEKIVATKCYHYGNMEKGLYIFSLKNDDDYVFVLENEKHYVVAEPNNWKLEHETYGNVVSVPLEDYLTGKELIGFPALYCHCFNLNGNRIEKYADGSQYKEDIRHIVIIEEWQMNKFAENRVNKGKKIKDFYEVEFALPKLIEYWGEGERTDEEH